MKLIHIPIIAKRILPDCIQLYELDGITVFKTHNYEYCICLIIDNFTWGIKISEKILHGNDIINIVSLIKKEANLFLCRILLGE